jgi:hypothetical protein
MDYAYLTNLYGGGRKNFGWEEPQGFSNQKYGKRTQAFYDYDDDYDTYKMVGGADFTPEECQQWLADNFTNPRTGRKIGPTKTGRGVYHDLQQACMDLQSGYKLQTPAPVTPSPLKRTESGGEIQRSTATGRKGPSASATSVPVGTQRVGNDGQMYIVKLRSNGSQYWQPCSQKTANC